MDPQTEQMREALKDLVHGATLMIDSGLLSGAFLSFAKEVKRVAEAGLEGCP